MERDSEWERWRERGIEGETVKERKRDRDRLTKQLIYVNVSVKWAARKNSLSGFIGN